MMDFADINQLVEEYLQDQAKLKELEKHVQKNLCLILAYQKDEERYKYIEYFDSLSDYAEQRLGIKNLWLINMLKLESDSTVPIIIRSEKLPMRLQPVILLNYCH